MEERPVAREERKMKRASDEQSWLVAADGWLERVGRIVAQFGGGLLRLVITGGVVRRFVSSAC